MLHIFEITTGQVGRKAKNIVADGDLGLQRTFPMMVLPVAEVLALERFPRHEEVKEKLVEFKAGMKVIFISQTWLSFAHNDNEQNDKAKLLKKLLQRAIAGQCKVTVRFEVAILKLDKPLRIPTSVLQQEWSNAYVVRTRIDHAYPAPISLIATHTALGSIRVRAVAGHLVGASG